MMSGKESASPVRDGSSPVLTRVPPGGPLSPGPAVLILILSGLSVGLTTASRGQSRFTARCPMTPDRNHRRHEIAVRARSYLEGLIPRSSVLEDLEAEDWEDPVLRPLLETIENSPKKSRFSGLWGQAYDAYVARTRALIDAADPGS